MPGPFGQERGDAFTSPGLGRLPDEHELETAQAFGLERIQCGRERLDALLLVDASEERQASDRIRRGARCDRHGLPGSVRSREVRDHERCFRQLPAAGAHPIEEIRARADDDVRQLEGGLFEDADVQHSLQIPEGNGRREVDDIASRPMAEDDEQ